MPPIQQLAPILLLAQIHLIHAIAGNSPKNGLSPEKCSIDLHLVLLLQPHFPLELGLGLSLRNDILAQLGGGQKEPQRRVELTFLHKNGTSTEFGQENWAAEGYWAIWPALGRFTTAQRMAKWTLFTGPHVEIANVRGFVEHLLSAYDHSVPKFIGKCHFDESPTIIHHFHGAGTEDDESNGNGPFAYGQMSTGFALSAGTLQAIFAYFRELQNGKSAKFPPNFIIDPGFEFSQLVLEATGLGMEEDDVAFCAGHQQKSVGHCFVTFRPPDYGQCGNGPWQGQGGAIFYAVKTHTQNHRTRVPIIQRTWAHQLRDKMGFFSDSEDGQIPTVHLGVPNTRRGHCGKSLAILRHFLSNLSVPVGQFRWLLLADDDTLLSVARLERFVQCLPQNGPIIAGQRYGYGFSLDGASGYDYPTGGAGILFSRESVEMIARNCDCPTPDSPDDMIIGICARRLAIPIVHSAAFHQARPMDYPKGHLQAWADRHISFHKLEGISPEGIYKHFLVGNGEKVGGAGGRDEL